MEKYEKVKQIGEGSFGKAILVKSKDDGRQYVIKEIGISGMSRKERQESRREVAVLANMSHPNIVQYKESFEEGGCLYIVMDYCEGGDLFKKINSQKGVLFPEEQILDWFVQICLALKHVHGRKILHRDIKSQNIFLTKEGTVQLGDFGIARVLNSTVELARTCIGTPYYLSPEICENKPYNNKSDIWALGCVLYEMCTLKHAFEAGNMKNLVLKIIRGSYPPVSVHYSQELRSLLAQLFKRNPRERPSIGNILDKPFLSCRIERFLTPQIIAQEFRHTFLHKQPKMGVAQVPPAQKITKPACKYGVPLAVRKAGDGAKKPSERKAAVKHKPAVLPAAPHRRISQVEEERKKHEDGIRKKRMELIEKERKQREQISRINQAREQGWKHVLSSSGGSSPERKCFVGGKRAAGVQASVLSPYEHHYAAVDQMAKPQPKDPSREGPSAGPGSPIRGVPAAAGPVLPNGPARRLNSDVIKRELQRLHHVSKQAQISRQRGQIPAERAFQVEEFLQRKREAMLNKVKAEGQLGTRQNLAAIYGSRAGSARFRRPKVNKEEEEYLARLRQIRLQNFNERQQIKARLRGEKYDSDGSDSQESSEEAELRRKKIEVLKAQANARVAVLKEQLEKKRREAYEREKKAWEDHLGAARAAKSGVAPGNAAGAASSSSDGPPPQAAPPQPDPAAKASAQPSSKASSPLISMTAALENVGAITPPKENLNETEATAVTQQSEKKQILRRLNQNLKAQSPVDETEETPSPPPPAPSEPTPAPPQQLDGEKCRPSDGDRKKWEVAELPAALPVPQQTFGETCSTSSTTLASPEERPCSGGDRKKWEAAAPLVLAVAQQTLGETCITTTDQTLGEVIWMGELQEDSPRKAWEANPVCEGPEALRPLAQQPEVSTTSDCVKIPSEPFTSAVGQRPTDGNQDSGQKTSVVNASLLPGLTDIEDPADLESVILEESPKQESNPPANVQQAWEQEVQKQMPHGGATGAAGPQDIEKSSEKPTDSSCSAQNEEPLFLKCSPAHRRAAALSVMSANSSMDESSSSLASRSRSVSPLRTKNQDALLIGLSAGMFDANNPKMLRTCSLPDLSRLFSPQQDSTEASKANVSPDKDLEIEDLEEAVKDDDQSDAEDAYEDEDLRDIRASMVRLLQEEGDRNPVDVNGAGDYNGNPPQEGNSELFNKIAAELDQDNNQMAVDDDEEDDEEDEDDEDEEEDEDEDEECSNGSPADDEVRELLANGDGEERQSDGKQLNEEWQSDGSGDDQCVEVDHHDSIFSRLEELRFNLEQQMGFEKFIEAYNKIKAIHEDEDENIELGSNLVSNILGTEHQHLYPNILHLVMADGAYQEDNDE
ncbi:PREDICTED: serine/threonine-protein kinase Nek1 isoform X3 [Poecilia mexicana]|uniref:serine/threonine-protein kinase Nek1 isoform X3 n=1 Tax=Poecilia mexicana TaxID=48701 RepID=UPI00072DACE7|nr:PREDICTED: serine/threonine-protein kinase Nek1 isoform X3 [Poecilia mexicana]